MQRVVITGMGSVSAYGLGVQALWDGLQKRESKVALHPKLQDTPGLNSHICALVPLLNEKDLERRFRRSMSRMGIFSAFAGKQAVDMADLDHETLTNGQTGICLANTVNSPYTLEKVFEDYFQDQKGIEQLRSTSFFKIMNHSCAANLAQYLGIRGRVIAPAAACATAGQSIALGAEAIAHGMQKVMLCGGADEVHPLTVGTFDQLDAASTNYNTQPEKASRPFDTHRDGVVCAEGAGVLVLEALSSARKRKAQILGEISGWSMNSSNGLAHPDCDSMYECIDKALKNSELQATDIEYVNAHATSTVQGDADEAAVLSGIFPNNVLVSSLKGHLGHTMAASGALETIAVLKMFQEQLILGTMNLENIDPLCSGINLLKDNAHKKIDIVLKNNFAFGGINTALIIRRFAQ